MGCAAIPHIFHNQIRRKGKVMTIEERAKAKYPTAYDIDTPSEVRAEKDAYIAGATEQQEIDIQRAADIYQNMMEQWVYLSQSTGKIGAEWIDLSKTKQSFIDAMKGEEK